MESAHCYTFSGRGSPSAFAVGNFAFQFSGYQSGVDVRHPKFVALRDDREAEQVVRSGHLTPESHQTKSVGFRGSKARILVRYQGIS